MNFGDLNDDTQLKNQVTNIHNSIDKIKNILQLGNQKDLYEKLETMDKVNYDLFLSYTLNTLYWLYLRTKGVDPNNNDIKSELKRIHDYMIKAKQAYERNTIRPRLDKGASKRFVRNGLWESKGKIDKEPPKKRKRFD